MTTNKFEESLKEGPHHQLQKLLGHWSGKTKTWFEKDVLTDESNAEATITTLLDGRFISIDYHSSLDGKPFVGKMILGFDIPYQRYTSSWIDSFHMGTQIMLSSGESKGNGFSVLGSYGNPEYGEALWGWRTEIQFISEKEFSLTAFNISPDGEEAKATETFYKKVG
ncbi:DUF1579 domain-containing protein [Leptospira bandrabouensis]|uniref:DUF1579 domain-containing protein n=1 Tax=Leptospira bandrabouensis TaxID=2484903 RepID=A0A6H3NXE8_9LEPT|nr:DUF1579 domain-containing protein [Leptospira bandrabouensis]MCG6143847.1 DUF1579 domain-containing protein [Leptospira bandrabouensis]MCG6159508.1 DUF1579 domain-containing protein [Leptospira bandrabouensis]MCG6163441.1 DUF1579 domain-containing protein [Leptospira bandrabouensis]MCW7457360.1 DUF1579 domain-containing protein [Leptospira bandrabouensis]MCW7476364.1 DUF1579 domain-containing protein [Leptospira bandrabouensis]